MRTIPAAKALLLTAAVALVPATAAVAQEPARLEALGKMPVKEVTVFKDGHAFVLHEGTLPTDAAGDVVMDYLPTPLMGAFWPYATEKGATLKAVVAGRRAVQVDRTALTIPELLEANVGAECIVTEMEGQPVRYATTILAFPTRPPEIGPGEAPSNREETPGQYVLLKTADGAKAVPLSVIRDVTFKGERRSAVSAEEMRNLLTLKLDWGAGHPGREAGVGLVYLQQGLRWIPSYKVVLDGKGSAQVKLQATLVNDLADLEDATANLVVGVPRFAFKGTVDPIAIQADAAELSRHMNEDSRNAYGFSNAIMTQASVAYLAPSAGSGGPAPAGPDVTGSEKSEDLYVFTVKHVTLRKGERMVLPVAEIALKYRDVFTLTVPYAPPSDVGSPRLDDTQQAEVARLFAQPKVQHKFRLSNPGPHPLTTAPALVLLGSRLLAQGLMTYTPPGAEVDLEATTAVDIAVKKAELETRRTPNAVHWDGDDFTRVDLSGTLSLTNRRAAPTEVEVVRYVLGSADGANEGGKVEKVNVVEDDAALSVGRPPWWGWYSWPGWWDHFHGVGRITWRVTLPPGETTPLKYTWHYFWR